jgi:flagellar biosynthesis GTPase FlhF
MWIFKGLLFFSILLSKVTFAVDMTDYHRTMINHYMEQQDYVAALKSIDALLEQEPDNKEFQVLKKEATAELSQQKKRNEEHARKQAAEALKRQQKVKAESARREQEKQLAAARVQAERNVREAEQRRLAEEQRKKDAIEAPVRRAKFLNAAICDCEGLRAYAQENIEREQNVGNISGVVDKVKLHGLGTTVERCSRAIDDAKRALRALGSTETVCPPAKAISRGLGQDCLRYRSELAQKE